MNDPKVTVKTNHSSASRTADGWSSSSQLDRNCHVINTRSDTSSSEEDYAVPPDAYENIYICDGVVSPVEVRDILDDGSLVDASGFGERSHEEKSGYLNQLGDSKAKSSWKRRWFVLNNFELKIYKSKSDLAKQPLSTIAMSSVSAVRKLHNRAGNTGFEIACKNCTYNMTAETPAVTNEWIKVLQSAQKAAVSQSVLEKVGNEDACTTKGWLTKVKYGHSKRYFGMLIDNQLVFFKSPLSKMPINQMGIEGCGVEPVAKSSDESGSEDSSAGWPLSSQYDFIKNSNSRSCANYNGEWSIQIRSIGKETVYLVFDKREDKERWYYHLKVASNNGALHGTEFETVVHSLMEEQGDLNSILWDHKIFKSCEENIKTPLTTIENCLEKDAIALYQSAYLFTTVPMQASAIQYHIDLAQNALSLALKNESLQSELIAQLIKLTGSELIMKIQAWKLLALTVSLFSPTKYAVLWLLRRHLDRWAQFFELPQSSLAQYGRKALQRTLDNGGRKEPPSKLEALSLLSRNPSEHSLPHSIPVILPDGSYQVVGFDGSSTVQECLEEVCCVKGLRHPLYCGYTLYTDDPFKTDLLHALSPKQKVKGLLVKPEICDVISHWERQLREGKVGKVPSGKVIQIYLKQRFCWSHLSSGETEQEKIYRAYSSGIDIHKGIIRKLRDACDRVGGHMHFGDFKSMALQDQQVDWYEAIVSRFYPEKLLQVACRATLRKKLADHWQELVGTSQLDCARVVLGVLRRWRLFGSQLFKCSMKWRPDEVLLLAVNHLGVHLLSNHNPAMVCNDHVAYERQKA